METMLCALHRLPEVAGVTIFPGEAVTTGAPSASRPTLCPPAVGTSSPSDCLTRPVLEVLLTHCECNVCGYSVPLTLRSLQTHTLTCTPFGSTER